MRRPRAVSGTRRRPLAPVAAAAQGLRDRQAVVDTIVRLGRALDAQDWASAEACLADTITADYSSFRGTPPAQVTAAEFVGLRRQGLAGLRTQHLSANHLVEVDGARAVCRCDFVIHRWPTDPADSRFFHTYGSYTYGLRRAGGEWRIDAITQVAVRNEGDPMLHGALRRP